MASATPIYSLPSASTAFTVFPIVVQRRRYASPIDSEPRDRNSSRAGFQFDQELRGKPIPIDEAAGFMPDSGGDVS